MKGKRNEENVENRRKGQKKQEEKDEKIKGQTEDELNND